MEHLKSLKENGQKMLKVQVKVMLHDYLHIEKNRFTTWSPHTGRIEGQIYIPLPMMNLQSLPSIPVQKYLNKVKELAVKYMFNRHTLVDIYYSYKPTTDIYNWIPPFKGKISYLRIHFAWEAALVLL